MLMTPKFDLSLVPLPTTAEETTHNSGSKQQQQIVELVNLQSGQGSPRKLLGSAVCVASAGGMEDGVSIV